MRKYLKPLSAVLAGMATSLGLQYAGVEPLYAKLGWIVRERFEWHGEKFVLMARTL